MTEQTETETESQDDSSQVSESLGEEMLQYERQIFIDAIENDGLFVSAKGLSMETPIANFLRAHCDVGNLVFVLNSSEAEIDYYIKTLNSCHVHNTTYQTQKREELYLNGGIHFITTRILVVDLLKNRVPINKITGMVVLRAHAVLESCQEAFALRLYRQNNKTGFIKAFSSCVESFTIGFGQVERVMRTVFVKELYIWPRFHSVVVADLKAYQPEVVELHIPISETLREIQTNILNLMNLTVKELKRINKSLDFQEITVENCVTKKFHKLLQVQLDYVWYQLSDKTKQLIADLKTLHHLMRVMINEDAVTFYATISRYMTPEYAASTTWVMQKDTDQLYTNAKRLIFTGNTNEKILKPQPNPKWETLNDILKNEIPTDRSQQQNTSDKTPTKVLILCNDSRTCYQLQHVLTQGPKQYLFYNVLKNAISFNKISPSFVSSMDFLSNSPMLDNDTIEQLTATNKKRKINAEDAESEIVVDSNNLNAIFTKLNESNVDEETKNFYLLSMTQNENQSENETLDKSNFEHLEMESIDLTQIVNENPIVAIQTSKCNARALNLIQSLIEFDPDYIIMYHSDVTAIRQIELFEAKMQKTRFKSLKIYFLVHSGTVEEQSYLTTLRREKEAFELLIDMKSKMVVPEYQDGKCDDSLLLQREYKQSPEKNTRHAGGQEVVKTTPKIIVDIREFRSDLPAVIHRRGIEIEPMTISIGDYILTPDICVERKSISDLIQSLNSGRLYNQCVQMTRYYTKPMLLIEFDQHKPFHLSSNFMITNDTSGNLIQKKLQLLTLHFPKLKLIWSPSPYASAQLFEELKEGKEQPISDYARSISSSVEYEVIETQYNANIYDFLQKLPGVTSKTIDPLLRSGKNLNTLIKMTEVEINENINNLVEAKALYKILHETHKSQDANESRSSSGKIGANKRGVKKKFHFKK